LRKVFFTSRRFPFHLVIYPGSGPGFGKAYGWPVEPLDAIASTAFDVAIIENRLEPDDIAPLEAFLAGGRRAPVFFKMSDPETPRSTNAGVRYILGKADAPGVHYLSVYRPAGPLADFFAGLKRSQVAVAPFAYEPDREVEAPIAGRWRRVFLSGARNGRVYPLRESFNRRASWDPRIWPLVDRLPHPGYPDTGRPARHDVMRERFVARAAASTHFFLDPSRYRVELMKYLECAYAGSVPIGAMPAGLAPAVGGNFLTSDCRLADLRRATSMPVDEATSMAGGYRAAMRAARDAQVLDAALDGQINAWL